MKMPKWADQHSQQQANKQFTEMPSRGSSPTACPPWPDWAVCLENYHGNDSLWAWVTSVFLREQSLCPSLLAHFHWVWFGCQVQCGSKLLENISQKARFPNPGLPVDHIDGSNYKQLPTHHVKEREVIKKNVKNSKPWSSQFICWFKNVCHQEKC